MKVWLASESGICLFLVYIQPTDRSQHIYILKTIFFIKNNANQFFFSCLFRQLVEWRKGKSQETNVRLVSLNLQSGTAEAWWFFLNLPIQNCLIGNLKMPKWVWICLGDGRTFIFWHLKKGQENRCDSQTCGEGMFVFLSTNLAFSWSVGELGIMIFSPSASFLST